MCKVFRLFTKKRVKCVYNVLKEKSFFFFKSNKLPIYKNKILDDKTLFILRHIYTEDKINYTD